MPRVGGLIGLNTDAWVKQIMDAESYPLQALSDRRKATELRQSTWAAVKSSLQSFRSSLDKVRLSTAFDLRKASVADATVVDITASPGAATATHSISVQALASTHSIGSATFDSASTALGFAGAALVNGKTVNITAGDSLNKIRDTINGINGIGVTASVTSTTIAGVAKYQLVLTANTSGKAAELKLADNSSTVTSGNATIMAAALSAGGQPVAGTYNVSITKTVALNGVAEFTVNGTAYSRTTDTGLTDVITGATLDLKGTGSTAVTVAPTGVLKSLGLLTATGGYANQFSAAKDAQFTVDGTAYTRTQNTVSDLLPGVSFTLKKEGSTASTNFTIDRDTDGVINAVSDFVDAYNTSVGMITDQTAYNADKKKAGLLNGDGLARSLRINLKSTVTDKVGSLPSTLNTFSHIGLTTGKWGTTDYGKLLLDKDKLRTQLLNDQPGVAKIFTATDGIATRMYSLVDNAVKAATGSIASRDDGLTAIMKDMDKQITTLTDRLTRREKALRENFSRMEAALVRLKGQGSALAGMATPLF